MQARARTRLLLASLLVACHAPRGAGVFSIPTGPDPDQARLRFPDGHVTLNDTCMVRVDRGLTAMMPPRYVNGRPVGFC